MAEYKSFHYLMHKTPDAAVVHIVTGPDPLTFEELYSPRTDPAQRLLHKSEKSFWRTQDRVEFSLYEDRAAGVLVVTAQNVVNKAEIYRTVFLDLAALYFELEAKAQGNRDPLTKKKNKILGDDVLAKAAADFVLARLNIKGDPLPWPTFPVQEETTEQPTAQTTQQTTEQQGDVVMERMCTFDRMASDVVQLEVAPPPSYVHGSDSASMPAELLERLRALPPAKEAAPDTVVEVPTAETTAEEQSSVSTTTVASGTNSDSTATSSGGEGKASAKATAAVKKKSSATVVPAQTGSGTKSSGKAAGSAASAGGGSKSGSRSRKVAPS
mmetsp:Transcript_21861/g.36860  ORF Transcript_21861/g.36860 Transcript_21861/m.36860 type:complete len:326 (+) Transcript_21861:178-1155(+)|eukprot:CAMPEP_0114420752 /NCGR_PEP_ID=MMETSP0103-20121206/4720_1 /TAXON_ID=37642 ORGANISM="Paraphysomonas imperforata, Strain PA2" /NCGR_SAMPLE_ID=MMETSP0103 /ASSEMBLY_ACC=CAM_ASM_000201 /LENGTH=325 /DNA_ID=CAMNT_0001589243 /DNA_START=67 /DNA_END=1044 /DNA_ORIENTATION=-